MSCLALTSDDRRWVEDNLFSDRAGGVGGDGVGAVGGEVLLVVITWEGGAGNLDSAVGFTRS